MRGDRLRYNNHAALELFFLNASMHLSQAEW
jgi:hypothetical protein